MNISRNFLIVLIVLVFAGGVGTAYAGFVLPTITLAGNVVIPEGQLSIGTASTADNDVINFDHSSTPEQLLWDNTNDRFDFTDDVFTSATVEATDFNCPNCLGSADIATDAIGHLEIASTAVRTDEIADGQVMSVDIADGTIESVDIGTNAVGANELQNIPTSVLNGGVYKTDSLFSISSSVFTASGDTATVICDPGEVVVGVRLVTQSDFGNDQLDLLVLCGVVSIP